MLQTLTRMAVPVGLAITTAVWTSFSPSTMKNSADADGVRTVTILPEAESTIPYTQAFYATTAFAVASLVLSLFTRLGKQPSPVHCRTLDHEPGPAALVLVPGRRVLISTQIHPGGVDGEEWQTIDISDTGHSVDPATARSGDTVIHRPKLWGNVAPDGPDCGAHYGRHNSSRSGGVARKGRRTIWLQCEQCGASSRMMNASSVEGGEEGDAGSADRYFYCGEETAVRERGGTHHLAAGSHPVATLSGEEIRSCEGRVAACRHCCKVLGVDASRAQGLVPATRGHARPSRPPRHIRTD